MLDLIQHISLASPWWLLLALILPLFLFATYRNIKGNRTALALSAIDDQLHIRSWKTILWVTCKWLLGLGFLSMIIALSRPQVVLVEEEIKAEGIDIFLSMDLSSSMLSRDFEPDRLSVSKNVAIDFVNKRPYDRLGLVSFAGEAYTQSPLTTDHNIIEQLLSGLQCGHLSDGTAIGMGLATAVNRLKDSKATSKVVILLTDGLNNSGYIDPKTAADIAVEFNIKVYTIGVGSMGLALSPVGRLRNGQYQFARTRVEIDDKLLLEIASKTGGEYYRATNAEELHRIYEKIDELEKTEMEITVIRREKEYFRHFLFIGLGLFFVYFIITYLWLRVWPD